MFRFCAEWHSPVGRTEPARNEGGYSAEFGGVRKGSTIGSVAGLEVLRRKIGTAYPPCRWSPALERGAWTSPPVDDCTTDEGIVDIRTVAIGPIEVREERSP